MQDLNSQTYNILFQRKKKGYDSAKGKEKEERGQRKGTKQESDEKLEKKPSPAQAKQASDDFLDSIQKALLQHGIIGLDVRHESLVALLA